MVRYSISNTTSGRTLFRGMALVLFISLVSCIQGYAQTEKESLSHGANGIFEALSAQREGQGTIDITQPEDIKNQVGLVHQKQARHSEGERSGVHTQQGFRIQAYTGNLAKSKEEAYRRAKVDKLVKDYVAMCRVLHRFRIALGQKIADVKIEHAHQHQNGFFTIAVRLVFKATNEGCKALKEPNLFDF